MLVLLMSVALRVARVHWSVGFADVSSCVDGIGT